jgi:CheY-like chemotaxis protein
MARTLLIVDDDADLRAVLRRLLEPLGRIVEAADGAEALLLVKAERPALMLLDVSMPGLDGLTVLEDALSINPKLLVVMLTGEMDLHVARRALTSGAREYVTKPFDPRALSGEIERLLRESEELRSPDRPWRLKP